MKRDQQAKVLARINRLAGQVKGIGQMVEREDDCLEVVTQLMAVKNGAGSLIGLLLSDEAVRCSTDPKEKQKFEKLIKKIAQG